MSCHMVSEPTCNRETYARKALGRAIAERPCKQHTMALPGCNRGCASGRVQPGHVAMPRLARTFRQHIKNSSIVTCLKHATHQLLWVSLAAGCVLASPLPSDACFAQVSRDSLPNSDHKLVICSNIRIPIWTCRPWMAGPGSWHTGVHPRCTPNTAWGLTVLPSSKVALSVEWSHTCDIDGFLRVVLFTGYRWVLCV